MNNKNLYAAIRAAFPASLDTVAIESADSGTGATLKRYSWRELDEQTARIANLLASLNLPEGSRVAVQTEKSVEALMLYLGVLRAGYVYLPLNTAYQASEIEYFIGNAEPAVVVCSPKSLAWIQSIADAAKVTRVFTLDDTGGGTLMQAAEAHAATHAVATKQADDLAAILYTSGTTGRSKGAMLSHDNLLSNALTLTDYWGWSANDVLIHTLPIFHVHGLFVASHCALLAGAKMIWFAKFDPSAVIARMFEATVFKAKQRLIQKK